MKSKIDSATTELDSYLRDFEQKIEETTKQIAENITDQCSNGEKVYKKLLHIKRYSEDVSDSSKAAEVNKYATGDTKDQLVMNKKVRNVCHR